MNKINWKLRFKNKTTLVTLITCIVAFIYQMLGIFGFVPAISQDMIINAIGLLINIFCTLGIVVDPTTKGVLDSERANTYIEPK